MNMDVRDVNMLGMGQTAKKKAGRRHKTSFLRSAAALLQSLIPRATEQETIGNGAFHPAKHSLT